MSAPLSNLQLVKSDDTLRFKLFAQKVIVQSDARLTVDVHALMATQQHSIEGMEKTIRNALNVFIESDWAFSTIKRGGDDVGFERISLTASSRVALDEIYNLEERARAASTEGLSLKDPRVNYSLPSALISETVEGLRKAILEDALRQVEAFKQITSRSWRIGDISFGTQDNCEEPRFSKGGYRGSDETVVDLWENCDEAGMASAERITLLADVTLCASPLTA